MDEQQTDRLRKAATEQLERLYRLNKVQALERLKAMDPIVFEHLTAILFERRGYRAETVGASGDEGVDVFLRKAGQTAVVQCKRYDGSVGQPTIRDLYGTMMHNRADEAYLVTTGQPTQQAREWAFGKPIQLIDGFTLVDWIMQNRPDPQPRPTYAAPPSRSQSTSYNPPTRRPTSSQSTSSSPTRTAPQASPVFTNQAEPAKRQGTSWLWPAVIVLLIFFGAAVGIAYSTVADRWSAAPPAASGEDDNALSPTNVSNDETGSVDEEATPTPDEPEEESEEESEPTATWTPPPTPCSSDVDGQFAGLYSRSALGCATSGMAIVWSAWEPFERGAMLWRSDTDAAYAFYGQSEGRWFRINEKWDGSESQNRGTPPNGLQAPIRGFGYVWSIRDDIFQALGWATDKEKGFCALIQSFEQGFILQSAQVESCTADGLYNQALAGDWRPVTLVAYADERWKNQNPGEVAQEGTEPQDEAEVVRSPIVDSESGGVSESLLRPSSQGIFLAPRAGSINLDGVLDEWNGEWNPINTIVQGRDKHSGQADLSGAFQIRWSEDDLYLAVRVIDETYQSGPDGSNMWQGDGLEIHFDRLLSEDFSESQISNDDYQIGISFGPGYNGIRGYRWLPFDDEGSLSIPGFARSTDDGYHVEVRIPWRTFFVQSNVVQTNMAFGFNVSINDNDDPTPAQQTVLSASPARTDHKTPTEWGTLVLQ